MTTHPFTRWCGTAFILAGLSVALWPALHPWDQIAGARAGQSGAWLISHTFHFLAGFFALIGLSGLLARSHGQQVGRLDGIAFSIAFTGTALFTGTGLFTAFLWPTIAHHAPGLVEANGPFFSPPHPLIGISSLLFSGGYMLLALVLQRRGLLSTSSSALLTGGALLLAIPPSPIGPAPWAMFLLAGVTFGAGLFRLGATIRSEPALSDSRQPAHPAVA